jgi:hypothetical protein
MHRLLKYPLHETPILFIFAGNFGKIAQRQYIRQTQPAVQRHGKKILKQKPTCKLKQTNA